MKLDGTRRAAVDGYASAWYDLDLWPSDPKNWPSLLTKLHMWSNFGEIGSNNYEVIHPVFSGHCLLWLWFMTFWPQSLISTSINLNTPVTNTGRNALHWILRYGVHRVFGTHWLSHGWTHPKTVCASGTEVFWWLKHKNIINGWRRTCVA